MSCMGGDRYYTVEGKRKYVGLHGELLDRPWTAKRRRRPKFDTSLDDDMSIFDVAGITPHLITPSNPSLLGDVDEMARMFRQVCGQQESIAHFTDDKLLPLDSELRFAKEQVRAARKEVANILNNCLRNLGKVAESTDRWAKEVVSLTLQQENWWEGYNVFSGELQDEIIDKALKQSPPKEAAQYSVYLIRCLGTALVQLEAGKLSAARKRALVRRGYSELWRLIHLSDGLCHAWTYCVMLCLKVFLAHPDLVPLDAKDLSQGDDVADILTRIIEGLKESSPDLLASGDRVITQVDLAVLARSLRRAMDDYPCVQQDCGHKSFHDAYNQTVCEAQLELRHRVCSALGDRLPAELVEMIVEAVVIAEEVDQPLQADLEYYEEVERLHLNCERSRWNEDTNRPWGSISLDSAPMDGQSDREYDSEDLKPRRRRASAWHDLSDQSRDWERDSSDNYDSSDGEGVSVDVLDENSNEDNEADEE